MGSLPLGATLLPGEQPNSNSRTATADTKRMVAFLGRRPPRQPREGQSRRDSSKAAYRVAGSSFALELVRRGLVPVPSTPHLSTRAPPPSVAAPGRSPIVTTSLPVCVAGVSRRDSGDPLGIEAPPSATLRPPRRAAPDHRLVRGPWISVRRPLRPLNRSLKRTMDDCINGLGRLCGWPAARVV